MSKSLFPKPTFTWTFKNAALFRILAISIACHSKYIHTSIALNVLNSHRWVDGVPATEVWYTVC